MAEAKAKPNVTQT